MHAPHDLHVDDERWAQDFAAASDHVLGQHDDTQGAFWPVDDFIMGKAYVACPRRGTHTRLAECWMCFGDVAYGYATADEVLAAGEL